MKPVEDCAVSVSPMTDEVRRDLKEERDSETWWAMYDTILAELEAADEVMEPMTMLAEVERRLRNG